MQKSVVLSTELYSNLSGHYHALNIVHKLILNKNVQDGSRDRCAMYKFVWHPTKTTQCYINGHNVYISYTNKQGHNILKCYAMFVMGVGMFTFTLSKQVIQTTLVTFSHSSEWECMQTFVWNCNLLINYVFPLLKTKEIWTITSRPKN